jgi:hypothetical protein
MSKANPSWGAPRIQEARITFSMRHQSIVRIYEFFKLNNTAYIAYEMLELRSRGVVPAAAA